MPALTIPWLSSVSTREEEEGWFSGASHSSAREEPDPNKNANQHKRREHGRPDRRPPLAQEADTAAFVSLASSLFLHCC